MMTFSELVQISGIASNPWLFLIPMVFSLLDVVTGIASAAMHGKMRSSKMREGLFHKLGLIFCLVLSALLQIASGALDLGFQIPTLAAVSVFYIVLEAVSILENIAELVPVIARSGIFKVFENVVHAKDNYIETEEN